ncbi:helix-turn-helix domain-containing protein [Cupriavidus sp. D39]|uniref:helix-turn-helix domain-containing protein n=1 Tax=Cupriavidus sp. D39 TaxID=2997877 RepID=UPI002271AA5B|nr:helix-turn-helix transcriptional regulator [Cupriavidus sp. D39]MCY0857550.1 helix-turn-helix transcriptional regulator [Cupriavidus sp. D39]
MARPSISEIGPNLARLRDSAGLKQAELAARLTMSAPSLSRVESGERPLAPDELQSLLASIGTEDALRFSEYLGRDWQELPVPLSITQNRTCFGKPTRQASLCDACSTVTSKPPSRSVSRSIWARFNQLRASF